MNRRGPTIHTIETDVGRASAATTQSARSSLVEALWRTDINIAAVEVKAVVIEMDAAPQHAETTEAASRTADATRKGLTLRAAR